mgnify:CR=1 FL=1
MKKFILFLIYGLLLLNTLGAFFGSSLLITDPTGTRIQLPPHLIHQSPFSYYLIPGIILFLVNGVLGVLTIYFLWRRKNSAPDWVILQGVLLGGWIMVEMYLINHFDPFLHVTFLGVALVLFFGGYWLKDKGI